MTAASAKLDRTTLPWDKVINRIAGDDVEDDE